MYLVSKLNTLNYRHNNQHRILNKVCIKFASYFYQIFWCFGADVVHEIHPKDHN